MSKFTMEEVLDAIQEVADMDGEGFIVRDNIGDNWNPQDQFWNQNNAVYFLEQLDVNDASERVDWFSISYFSPEDILAMANAHFELFDCQVCGNEFFMSGESGLFLEEYCLSARSGAITFSRSNNEIFICNKCIDDNPVVRLFLE